MYSVNIITHMCTHTHTCTCTHTHTQEDSDGEAHSHLGRYWKQLGVVTVLAVFMFVYEFCERYNNHSYIYNIYGYMYLYMVYMYNYVHTCMYMYMIHDINMVVIDLVFFCSFILLEVFKSCSHSTVSGVTGSPEILVYPLNTLL